MSLAGEKQFLKNASTFLRDDEMRYYIAELKYLSWVSTLEKIRLSNVEGSLSTRLLSSKYAYAYCGWICKILDIPTEP